MAVIPLVPEPTGAFAVLHRQVTGSPQLRPGRLLLPAAEAAEGPVRLSPAEAWQGLYGRPRDRVLRRAIWQQAIRLAHQEARGAAGPDGGRVAGWQLVTLWLAVPCLRSTVRRLGWEFGLERAELESAAVLGLMQRLAEADPEHPAPESLLVRGAIRHCWALVGPARRERAVAAIDAAADVRGAGPDPAEELAWELSITPPNRPDGLAAALRFRVSRESVEGVRLGALAERFGLREVVHRARRPKPGPRLGSLALRPVEAHR
ncbi:hypothetical protein [Kitasatospora sp. NPDC093558]|uniref:hypothetical protein n=1 Tax=Kitasatospora sp. NPDC093558 TaxID=3155201 RepID=UPI003448D429